MFVYLRNILSNNNFQPVASRMNGNLMQKKYFLLDSTGRDGRYMEDTNKTTGR